MDIAADIAQLYLMHAAKKGSMRVCEFIASRPGYDAESLLMDKLNIAALPPLYVASQLGHVGVIEILVKLCGDACFSRPEGESGITMAHCAARYGQVAFLQEMHRLSHRAAEKVKSSASILSSKS